MEFAQRGSDSRFGGARSLAASKKIVRLYTEEFLEVNS
jgi:hypothetical protein